MNWIYDEETPHSRLAVAIDRRGITVCQWSDDTPDDEEGFDYQEGFFTWEDYKAPLPHVEIYRADDRMVTRIMTKATALLAAIGGSSDVRGIVPSLHHRIDCGHVYRG